MKAMGYVNMFNRGIGQVQTVLKENGNPPAEFDVNLITAFRVNVRIVESPTSLKDMVATLKKKVSSEEMAIYILEYCDTWRSMDEIALFANRDKNYIRNKVLPKFAEKLEKEYPDIPNHPQQRYRTKPKDSQLS